MSLVYNSSLEVMALWTIILSWLLILSSTNQLGITALIYCVLMNFVQRGNFLLEVFQAWVYRYFMEAHNNILYSTLLTKNSQLPGKSSRQSSSVTILSYSMTD